MPSAVRGPVLRPPCMRQRSFPLRAGARQGQPARVRAPHRGIRARVGLPRRLAVGGGDGGSVFGGVGEVVAVEAREDGRGMVRAPGGLLERQCIIS